MRGLVVLALERSKTGTGAFLIGIKCVASICERCLVHANVV